MTCFLGDDLAVGRVHFRILLKLMILSIIFGWQVFFKINFSQKSGGKGGIPTRTAMMIVKVMKTYLSFTCKGIILLELQRHLLSQCSDSMYSPRRAKHDPGPTTNSESTIKQHAESMDHNFHSRDTQILKCGMINYHKRLFLELLHSTLESAAISERKRLLRACLLLI